MPPSRFVTGGISQPLARARHVRLTQSVMGTIGSASIRSAQLEAITLHAYREALTALRWCADDPPMLIRALGSIDEQASHPATDARLELAGRLIAAAQLSGPALMEGDVEAMIRACLAQRAAQRDDAAPSPEPRLAPEEDRVSGLDNALLEWQRHGALGREALEIAGMILRHLIRPPMDLDRTLALGSDLGALAGSVLALLDDTSPFGLADDQLDELLAHAAVRVRAAKHSAEAGAIAWERDPLDDWLHIAAASAGAHAVWAGQDRHDSMHRSVARATERLASSLVPEQPERFPVADALDHVSRCAFDAAVTALGLSLHPSDPVLTELKADVLDALLEATSSALIGAWVLERRGPQATM
jgi:hypothetical protein